MTVSFVTLAQTPAEELVNNSPTITNIERGHSIDAYGEYTLLGSNFGLGHTQRGSHALPKQHICAYLYTFKLQRPHRSFTHTGHRSACSVAHQCY